MFWRVTFFLLANVVIDLQEKSELEKGFIFARRVGEGRKSKNKQNTSHGSNPQAANKLCPVLWENIVLEELQLGARVPLAAQLPAQRDSPASKFQLSVQIISPAFP